MLRPTITCLRFLPRRKWRRRESAWGTCSFTTLESALSRVPYWMAKNIAIHETNESQFCEPGRAQAAYCSNSANVFLPIWGRPGGYGAMQYDPDPGPPSIDEVWNWRTNITSAGLLLASLAGKVQDTSNTAGNPIVNTNST
jgi:hypothetical protein